MRRSVLSAAVLVLAVGSLAACGDEEDAPPASDQETKTIEITFEGDTVDPNGDRVEVGLNQPIEFVVTADAPGEIHVHSKPDGQEFEYAEGTTTIPLTIDKPGLVEVESHDLDQVIVQLEVK